MNNILSNHSLRALLLFFALISQLASGDELKDLKIKANQGDAIAQTSLGLMYQEGEGTPKDEKKAFYWYSKAANQGLAIAQASLGLMYEDGEGTPKDEKQAFYWYSRAANQGLASAQARLGLMYEDGEGTPKDERQAYIWFSLADKNGISIGKAQKDLLAKKLTPRDLESAQQAAAELHDKIEANKAR
jgi:TPR repeat protein